MAIYDMCDRLVRYLGDCLDYLLSVGRRRINHDHTGFINHEHRLINVVCYHIQTLAKLLDSIPFGRINQGTLR